MASSTPSSPRPLLVAVAVVCLAGLVGLALLTGPSPEPVTVSGEAPRPGAAVGVPRLSDASPGADEVDDSIGASEEAVAPRRALPVDLEAAPEGTTRLPEHVVRLRVTSAESGAPVEDVDLLNAWDGERRRTAGLELTPGPEGVHELSWRGGGRLDVELGAAGFEAVTVVDLEGSLDTVTEIELRRSASLRLSSEGFDEEQEGLLAVFQGTDASGRARSRETWVLSEEKLVSVSPGPISLLLLVPGQPPVSQLGLDVAAGESRQLTLTASRGEVFRGRVIEKVTRQPLPGVGVQARPALAGVSGAAARVAYPSVVTGEDGRFLIEGLPVGPLEVVLEPSFGPPVIRQVHVAEGDVARTRDLAIGGPAVVSGKVRCGEGVDPAGLTVLLIAPGELSRLRPDLGGGGAALADRASDRRGAIAEVGEGGTFSCRTAPSGRPVGVLAQSGAAIGYTRIDGSLAPGEERAGIVVDLELPDPATFRVVNDLDEPVPAIEARLRFLISDSRGGGAGAAWTSATELVDDAGRFVTAVPAGAVRRIRLASDGHLDLDTSWPLAGGAPVAEPTFQMVACESLSLLIQDEYGFAVKGARVDAWPAEQSLDEARSDRMLRSTRSSRRGRGALDLDRAVDDWVVVARAAGHRSSDRIGFRKGDTEELRLVLEREESPALASVAGRLVRRGDGASVPGLSFSGLRGGVAVMEGADFELRGIRSGRVQIVASAPGYESIRLPVDELLAGQHVELEELRTQATSRLRVIVTDRAGNQVRRARVRLLRVDPKRGGRSDVPKKIRFPAVGDSEGGFERAGIPRGSWTLTVDHAAYARFQKVVRVQPPSGLVEVILGPKKRR